MKKEILTLSILAALGLASCGSMSSTSYQYAYRKTNIPNRDIITSEVIVDLKLDLTKKIVVESAPHNSAETAKEEAYYKALVQNNVDVIVDPIYEVKTTTSVNGIKSIAKITGYGANYVNPRNKVEAINDLNTIKSDNVIKFNEIYTTEQILKK